MKFVDFFAGIGGIRLGLERSGHECVGFCEWDKFARQAYKAMYDTEGEWESHDIRTVDSADVPRAELWTGGFPCQDLSLAGKRKGLQEGERSGLFYEIIRLLSGLRKEDRPKWVLLENVKGLFSAGRGFDFLRCIVELGQLGYNIEYQLLNSKDFGVPQNRERVFIVGHLGNGSGREVFPLRRTDGENPVSLSQIGRLADGSVENLQTYRVYDKEGISPTLGCMEGGNRQPMIVDNIKTIGSYNPSGHSSGRVVDPQGIAPTVMENHGTVTAVAIEQIPVKMSKPFGKPRSAMSIEKEISYASTLCARDHKGLSHSSNAVVVAPVLTPDREEKRQNGRRMKEDGEPMFTLTAQDRHGVAIREATKQGYAMAYDGDSINLAQPNSQTRRGRVGKQIANTLTCGDTMGVVNGVRIRKLTPREVWRLQGFPDSYFDRAVAAGVSNSQLYKQAGNAVTVNVAEAIGRRLREIELGWLNQEECNELVANLEVVEAKED